MSEDSVFPLKVALRGVCRSLLNSANTFGVVETDPMVTLWDKKII